MVKIQWYPGHMEKARRGMIERMKHVDMVIELRDARIPLSSCNPIIKELSVQKPKLIILAKSDLADPQQTEKWIKRLSDQNCTAVALDLSHDNGVKSKIIQLSKALMQPWYDKQIAKGIHPRALRAMAAGIPNVGKSTLINKMAGKTKVLAKDTPGVTRSLTWIHADATFDLLDTPGVLWPKFDDEKTGSLLAACGSINENIVDMKMLAMDTIHVIQDNYPGVLENIFHATNVNPNGMLKAIANERHLKLENDTLDTKRAASLFIHEFRKAKYGRFTLETVENDEDMQQ